MNQAATAQGPTPVVRIRPSHGWVPVNLPVLWEHRELLYFLCWRDIKIRYKQTVLGIAWAILQPLLTMVIFSLFFGRLAKVPSDGVPYPIFAFAALVPWTFFANGLRQSTESLVISADLVKKVYFPRLLVPLASVLSGCIDFGLAFAMLVVMMLLYGVVPTAALLLLPLLFLLALITALGAGMWLTAMNVQFRDVKHAIPFLIQAWMFATPIAYPSSLISNPTLRALYGLNPMVGVVDGFRWALLATEQISMPGLLLSSGVAVVMLITGAYYFRRLERSFADVV